MLLHSFLIMALVASLGWLYSVFKRNVNIVDVLWSMLFMMAGIYVFFRSVEMNGANLLLLVLLSVWALRLSAYLLVRSIGKDEDRRYQVIRANNQPNFGLKSLFIVFLLQACIAWVIFLPLLSSLYSPQLLTVQQWIGASIVLFGIVFEGMADQQLLRFKRERSKSGDPESGLLDSGLWRYSRHPNYFGEFLVWWGFFIFVFSSGDWWMLVSPVLMTLLLLKVSGIGLMEKGIESRRPGYAEYAASTSAFIPLPPRPKVNKQDSKVNA